MRAWLLLAVLSLELVGIVLTSRAWRSELAFWQHATTDAPAAVPPRINLAVSLGVDGRIAEARIASLAAWDRLPGDPSPLLQRANMAWNLTNLDRALNAPETAPEPVSGFIDQDRLWLARANSARWWVGRPLTLFTLRLQAWANAGIWDYRLANLALHLLAGALVWALCGSWVIAAIWLLLPWHVETIATLAGRGELLAGIGVLVACLAAQSSRWIWMGVGIAVAFASKESAIVLLALVPLWLTRRRFGWAWPMIGAATMTAVCVVSRLAGRVPYVHPTVFGWATDQAASLALLVTRIALPPVYLDPRGLPAWIAPVALVALAIMGLIALRLRWTPMGLALTWILVALLPRFIVLTPGAVLHSRHLYVASMGLAWAYGHTRGMA